jgi:hypothetical protein
MYLQRTERKRALILSDMLVVFPFVGGLLLPAFSLADVFSLVTTPLLYLGLVPGFLFFVII